MKHFLKKAKWIAQSLACLTLFIQLYAGLYIAMRVIAGTPKGYDKTRVADNISEYFTHLSSQQVDNKSDIDRVVPVQLALKFLGYKLGPCGADGIYGEDTSAAVILFQQQHNLPCTGETDPVTYRALARAVIENKDVSGQLDSALLAPYRTEKARKVMGDLGNIFSTGKDLSLFLRPDITAYAGFEALVNDFRSDVASEVFPGCANLHLRDAFRHSDSIFRIAGYAGSSWAVMVGDIREKGEFNGLPGFLMDVYNHRVAAGLREKSQSPLKNADSLPVFKQAIHEGEFVLYPFPLVPKKPDISLAQLG